MEDLDIKGISPTYCIHKRLMEENFKQVIQPQRQLNLNINEMVKKEVIKLLNAGVTYPISSSMWISLIQVVSKKCGMTMVENDKMT